MDGIDAILKEVLLVGAERVSPNFEVLGANAVFIGPPDEKVGNTAGAITEDDAFKDGELCLKMFEESRVGCDFDTACTTLATEAGEPNENSVLLSSCDSALATVLLVSRVTPDVAGGSTV